MVTFATPWSVIVKLAQPLQMPIVLSQPGSSLAARKVVQPSGALTVRFSQCPVAELLHCHVWLSHRLVEDVFCVTVQLRQGPQGVAILFVPTFYSGLLCAVASRVETLVQLNWPGIVLIVVWLNQGLHLEVLLSHLF